MASRIEVTAERALREQRHIHLESICAALQVNAYPGSVTVGEGLVLALVRRGQARFLLVLSEDQGRLAAYEGAASATRARDTSVWARLCSLSPHNAQLLRRQIPHLAPVVPARGPSIGTGDRLGLATPGHLAALRGHAIFPVLAQQSIREMLRTGRTPREVVDDAMWGVLQMGYPAGYAADADHLQTPEDIARTDGCGFTMYTIDPSEWVDERADRAPRDVLAERYAALPWAALGSTPDDCRRAYADRKFRVAGPREPLCLTLRPAELLRAAVKYGHALARTTTMYQCLLGKRARASFAFELSVDETSTPTSAAEHFYLAAELRRLGVTLDGFAPRFVGEFYKGVEYVGDLERFRAALAWHVALARHFGGYKISLHSGSDKFTIYPIVAELAGDRVHIKTAGTSYLEALRVVAGAAPELFREILAFSRRCYSMDKNSYHVCADPARVAAPEALRDEDLPRVLDQPDARQVCHVTFGSVLSTKTADGQPLFRERLLSVLRHHEQEYNQRLQAHFTRHISPFL